MVDQLFRFGTLLHLEVMHREEHKGIDVRAVHLQRLFRQFHMPWLVGEPQRLGHADASGRIVRITGDDRIEARPGLGSVVLLEEELAKQHLGTHVVRIPPQRFLVRACRVVEEGWIVAPQMFDGGRHGNQLLRRELCPICVVHVDKAIEPSGRRFDVSPAFRQQREIEACRQAVRSVLRGGLECLLCVGPSPARHEGLT